MTKEEKADLLNLAIKTRPIDSTRRELARLALRTMRHMEGLSYSEAIKLANEADETLKHLPTTDPALDYFMQQRRSMLKYATALADANNSAMHDHEEEVHVLVEFMDVATEVRFHVRRLDLCGLNRRNAVESEIRRRLRLNDGFGYYVALGRPIDLFEL